MELTSFEKTQLDVYNGDFKRGKGFSRDHIRFNRYFDYLKHYDKMYPYLSVLDVGCGPGPLEEYLFKNKFKFVEAIDYSEEGIKIAKKLTPQYKYTVGNVQDINKIYDNRIFDIIFCCQVLEHIPEHKDIIKKMYKLLSLEGILIISTPWNYCKNNEWHVNHYLPETFDDIFMELFNKKAIATERFGEGNLQLLVVLQK